MQGKKVDYLPFLLPPLFRNTWDYKRCKIAKREGVKIKGRTLRSSKVSKGFFMGLASFVEFRFLF
jgi:hypothetical protein